ncbi:MAG TPA: hypothetical protein PKB10_03780 [Tepidisphaeraceae bacterium]|nr:hypothetical protein [Tepidisphaeraceae bacterium]
MRRLFVMLLVALGASGCEMFGAGGSTPAPPTPAPDAVPPAPATRPVTRTQPLQLIPSPLAPRAVPPPRDARPSPTMYYQLIVFQLTAPIGEISENAELWKPIDEQIVSPATYDLLWKNGIRVGTAPVSRLVELERYLDSPRSSTVGYDAKFLELFRVPDIAMQNVFYLDRNNTLHGRSFDRSDNVLYLSFQTAPRRPGHVQISLSPAVQTYRRRLEFSEVSGRADREIRFFSPQVFYDVNLRVDLPVDHCLLVAPSRESMFATSLGRLFFTIDTPTERLERAYVFLVRAQGAPHPNAAP